MPLATGLSDGIHQLLDGIGGSREEVIQIVTRDPDGGSHEIVQVLLGVVCVGVVGFAGSHSLQHLGSKGFRWILDHIRQLPEIEIYLRFVTDVQEFLKGGLIEDARVGAGSHLDGNALGHVADTGHVIGEVPDLRRPHTIQGVGIGLDRIGIPSLEFVLPELHIGFEFGRIDGSENATHEET